MFLVYVTFGSLEEARSISASIIEGRFAACANILPGHEALYWWEGQLQNEAEVAVIYKTTEDMYPKLEMVIKDKHSYNEPCIVALPINTGSEGFLNWVVTQLASL